MSRVCCLVLSSLAAAAAADDVDTSPLPIRTAEAFPDVEWTGWTPILEDGRVQPLRPILVTHAGDGSGRLFVPTQQGVVYVLRNTPSPQKAEVFLDIRDKVAYDDKTNEEGLLGLAFHPRFAENGEFFVFYTNDHKPRQNVVARYRRAADDPNRADAASEEIVLTFDKPFWNHDGGTILFGPDGFLYVTHGDGGAANDPFRNGQNLKTLLGKILRIDVDRKDDGEAYAVPPDNPFVDREGARPEIWAYGLRNVWRMAFDRKTGRLWAADVGQDTWEEINIIEKGGNYGWNLREGLHPFGPKGWPASPELIDPIWEYHHDVGKSITGGFVYRGKELPELFGAYLYADYVSGKIWALWYDDREGRVTANRPISDPGLPILSFGEDEEGEAYLTTTSATGRGILKLIRNETP
jgi:glucose/arabinose dehydrogenase